MKKQNKTTQTEAASLHPVGSAKGLADGKTAEEWFGLHETMRKDFGRVVGEKEELAALLSEYVHCDLPTGAAPMLGTLPQRAQDALRRLSPNSVINKPESE